MVFGSWSDQRPKLNLQDHVKHVTILWCRLALAWPDPGRVWLPETNTTNVMIHYILSLVSTTVLYWELFGVYARRSQCGYCTCAVLISPHSHRMLAFRRWTVVSVAALRYFSTMPNPTVYFDITAGGKGLGRVTMEVSGWKIIAVS